jgi:hypothetical protein
MIYKWYIYLYYIYNHIDRPVQFLFPVKYNLIWFLTALNQFYECFKELKIVSVSQYLLNFLAAKRKKYSSTLFFISHIF